MTPEHLPPPLETSLAVVREWLDKITAPSTNPELDLRNLRAVLIHLLETVEQDPAIECRHGQPCRRGVCLPEGSRAGRRYADKGGRPRRRATPQHPRASVLW